MIIFSDQTNRAPSVTLWWPRCSRSTLAEPAPEPPKPIIEPCSFWSGNSCAMFSGGREIGAISARNKKKHLH